MKTLFWIVIAYLVYSKATEKEEPDMTVKKPNGTNGKQTRIPMGDDMVTRNVARIYNSNKSYGTQYQDRKAWDLRKRIEELSYMIKKYQEQGRWDDAEVALQDLKAMLDRFGIENDIEPQIAPMPERPVQFVPLVNQSAVQLRGRMHRSFGSGDECDR